MQMVTKVLQDNSCQCLTDPYVTRVPHGHGLTSLFNFYVTSLHKGQLSQWANSTAIPIAGQESSPSPAELIIIVSLDNGVLVAWQKVNCRLVAMFCNKTSDYSFQIVTKEKPSHLVKKLCSQLKSQSYICSALSRCLSEILSIWLEI